MKREKRERERERERERGRERERKRGRERGREEDKKENLLKRDCAVHVGEQEKKRARGMRMRER